MRLAAQPVRKLTAAGNGELRLSIFGEGLRRPPSQKELASILLVTTRHLRRWENAETAAGRACSRPYTHADLWRLYQYRGRKGWDHDMATRLGLASVFERFDQTRFGGEVSKPKDRQSMMAALMLKSIAMNGDETFSGEDSWPRTFGAGLAEAARSQLRVIVNCDQACDLLVKAFFEAALVAEAKHPAKTDGSAVASTISA